MNFVGVLIFAFGFSFGFLAAGFVSRTDATALSQARIDLIDCHGDLTVANTSKRIAENRAGACEWDRKLGIEEDRCRALYDLPVRKGDEVRADIARCVEVFKLETSGLAPDGGLVRP